MDTDFIREYLGLFIGIAVTVLVGLFGNKDKKSEKRPQTQHAKRPVQPQRRPAPRAAVAPVASTAPKAPASDFGSVAFLPPEGERVTRDVPQAPQPVKDRPTLKPLDRDGLRNAVIWGEILKPKF